MAATAGQIAEVRRMMGELTTAIYSDTALQGYIERYPLADVNGQEPFISQYQVGATTTKLANPLWIPTYDLNAAAADVWQEKGAMVAPDHDFSADGGSYQRSQTYTHAMQMHRHYRARRSPQSIQVKVYPPPVSNAQKITDDINDLDTTN